MIRWDCIIIGGGLGGLTLAIQMADRGWKVLLFEKNSYPFHRVCGEYISNESYGFMQRLGLELSPELYPRIDTVQVSAPDGNTLTRPLDLGGIGISRYTIDAALAGIALKKQVHIVHEKVSDVRMEEQDYVVTAGSGEYRGRVCCGAYGKRSNLDIRWKRSFIENGKQSLRNYIGVKYHIRTDFPRDRIALHNFKDGYCGISAVEGGAYCLCYLTTADNLKKYGNNIRLMEQEVLYRNPHLRQLFTQSDFLFEAPLTISQISFVKKPVIENGVFMLGDAAGTITPLCGNGMSMAMNASHLLAPLLDRYLQNQATLVAVRQQYIMLWRRQFEHRMRAGRWIQSSFGNELLTGWVIRICRNFPSAAGWLIRQTHGIPF